MCHPWAIWEGSEVLEAGIPEREPSSNERSLPKLHYPILTELHANARSGITWGM